MNPPSEPKGILERGAAADVMRHTLSSIPTIFGQLVYLAGVRNAGSGRYEHHGLALVYGEEAADAALRACHMETFQRWLAFGLREQKADLELYISALGGVRKKLVETWLQARPYETVLPHLNRRSVERRIYLANFEALLRLLANETGASLDPDA